MISFGRCKGHKHVQTKQTSLTGNLCTYFKVLQEHPFDTKNKLILERVPVSSPNRRRKIQQ